MAGEGCLVGIERFKGRGYGAERQLVKRLREAGFYAVRVPASAPSLEPLPDVFATRDDEIYAFEVKSSSGGRVYFHKGQVEKLFRFLMMFKPYRRKTAVLAVRFGRRWVLKEAPKPGDYVVKKSDRSDLKLF